MLFENNPAFGAAVSAVISAGSGTLFGTLLSRWDQQHWDMSKAPGYVLASIFLLGIIGGCAFWAARLAERNKAGQTSTARRETTIALLQSVAAAFGSQTLNAGSLYIRANVMRTSPDGKRRKVDHDTAFNMSKDNDRFLELRYDEGASGMAANSKKELMLVDLLLKPQPGVPVVWSLDPKNEDVVRKSLKTVMSIAIPNPDVPDGPVLGTLQVDSDNTLPEVIAHLLGVSTNDLVTDPAIFGRAHANVLGIMEPMARALSKILAVG